MIEKSEPFSPVYVTQPFLPPLEEYLPYLQEIWKSKILTNAGPMHEQLEKALCDYLGVKHISLFCNGTVALLTALQALNIKGEVITTPYSFVATSHAILWNSLKPVFVDIDPLTLNLDPKKIRAAITTNTSAILPVHCYGNPCDTEAIREIASEEKLKLIYDAAHAFGVEDSGGSILRHGDLSVLSFHATKVFNTFEGGAIVSPDLDTKRHIDYLKNFGFAAETMVIEAGINGKMSEINAAMGLLQLEYMGDILEKRSKVFERYCGGLINTTGIRIPKNHAVKKNYSYFPILVEDPYPQSRDQLFYKLRQKGIHARRYFYPLICDFDMYQNHEIDNTATLHTAIDVSKKVICLPMYPGLPVDTQDFIIELINNPNIHSVSRNVHQHVRIE